MKSRAPTLLWSVRRELWENRSVYVAPLAVAAIFLVGFAVTLPDGARRVFSGTEATRPDDIVQPYMFATLLIMATSVVVGVFYCLEALYAERRDRSILFWKSLPVSDRTTVLAKVSISLLILPLFATAVTVAVHFLMLVMSSVVLWTAGQAVAPLWGEVAPAQTALMLLSHVVTMHVLWYAPIFTWLLLASAWARRAPFLWAGIPLLAIAVLEKVVLGSTRFLDMLKFRFVTGPQRFTGSSDPLAHISLGAFVSSPDLWIGLGLSAVFLAAAVRIRRHRGPA